jgi:hypothetical protein
MCKKKEIENRKQILFLSLTISLLKVRHISADYNNDGIDKYIVKNYVIKRTDWFAYRNHENNHLILLRHFNHINVLTNSMSSMSDRLSNE